MIREKIKNFIVEKFLDGKEDLDYDLSLFDNDIIDSMQFIILLSFLEKEFDVSIEMEDISLEKFDSINKIAKTISCENKGTS